LISATPGLLPTLALTGLVRVGVVAIDGTKVSRQRQPRRDPRLRADRL
jgi:hypothetical protein